MGMNGKNGTTNGLVASGGVGGGTGTVPQFAAEILEQRNMLRLNVDAIIRTMEDHAIRGVPIKDEHCASFAVVAEELMKEHSPRLRFLGAKLVDTALRYNMTRFLEAQHEARLDTPGVPTERTEHLMGLKIIKGLEEGDI